MAVFKVLKNHVFIRPSGGRIELVPGDEVRIDDPKTAERLSDKGIIEFYSFFDNFDWGVLLIDGELIYESDSIDKIKKHISNYVADELIYQRVFNFEIQEYVTTKKCTVIVDDDGNFDVNLVDVRRHEID